MFRCCINRCLCERKRSLVQFSQYFWQNASKSSKNRRWRSQTKDLRSYSEIFPFVLTDLKHLEQLQVSSQTQTMTTLCRHNVIYSRTPIFFLHLNKKKTKHVLFFCDCLNCVISLTDRWMLNSSPAAGINMKLQIRILHSKHMHTMTLYMQIQINTPHVHLICIPLYASQSVF